MIKYFGLKLFPGSIRLLLFYSAKRQTILLVKGRAPVLKELSPGLLTLSRGHRTSIILLWLMPEAFTRQGESSRIERVK